jgi:hypothetical protein
MGKKKDTEGAAEKITQKEAVKRAIAAGKDSPGDGVAYVKDQFGITLNNGAFSTIKSQLKKASGATTRGRKPGRPAASANGVARTGGMTSSGKTPNPADLARGVKLLVSQYGAEAVKSMAEVFAE